MINVVHILLEKHFFEATFFKEEKSGIVDERYSNATNRHIASHKIM